jgi:uncharacterized protein (UPF0333 family)
MDERAQTSLEYLLLISGAVVFAVLVTLIVRNQVIGGVSNTVTTNASTINGIIQNFTNSS